MLHKIEMKLKQAKIFQRSFQSMYMYKGYLVHLFIQKVGFFRIKKNVYIQYIMGYY